MCRILLVEDAVPEPEALRVLIEQHPCAGAIQLESCAFSQVSERISQSPRIDALFAPVDAPGAFPACTSDERAGIELVRELQDRGILPLTVYCTTRAAYTSAVYGTDHQYLLLAPYSPSEARNALDKVFGLLGHRAASPLALRSAGTVHIVDPADVAEHPGWTYVVPKVIFNDDGVTLDDATLEDMGKAAGVPVSVVSCNATGFLPELVELARA